MPQPSWAVTVGFVALVAVVSALFVAGAWRAGSRLGEAATVRRRWTALSAALAGGVLAVSAGLAAAGVLQRFTARPPPIFLLFASVTALTMTLALSRFGLRLVRGLPVAALVGYQVFRVAVELVLFALHREGVVPARLTFEGANFDVLTGLSAPVVAWLAQRGRLSRGALAGWNATGLALLVVVVTLAILSMPTPLRQFHEGPPMAIGATVPFVWLPVLLVQGALLGHLLVFRWLRLEADRGAAPAPSPDAARAR